MESVSSTTTATNATTVPLTTVKTAASSDAGGGGAAAAATTTEAKQSTAATDETGTETASNQKEDWELQRDHEKQQGDQFFRVGGYKTAIEHYTQALSLDPGFVVAYSNRSAAYLKNSEKSKALHDAQKVTQLDPTYIKGYSRLAAALHSLKRWEKAKEAYHKVLELDGGNAGAKKGVADCQMELDKIQQEQQQWANEREHTKMMEEKKRRAAEEVAEDETKKGDEAEEEDDLLNEFFQDVEEVTKEQKEGGQAKSAVATNNVKNERVVLGTAQEQMDRLLQKNHEWRNLNPFYVLKLPHTATEDDVARRYKAMSLLLHPDKHGGDPRAQQAFDEVKKARTILLTDPDRARYCRSLIEEGLKQAETHFKNGSNGKTLEELQEKEVMRLFAQVEQKRKEVQDRERKFEQRTQQQEDEQEARERQERQFDKSWRKDDRVDKRVGNWRDFASGGRKKKRKIN